MVKSAAVSHFRGFWRIFVPRPPLACDARPPSGASDIITSRRRGPFPDAGN